jgi:hypothetical protein
MLNTSSVTSTKQTVILPADTDIDAFIDDQNRRIGKSVNGTHTQGVSGEFKLVVQHLS